MRIYAFRVAQRGPRLLGDVVQRLADLPMERRYFQGNAFGLRLEAMGGQDGFVLADVAAARVGHGPGRMATNAPMAEFDLGEGESFGEDTGFAYDPETGYLALQYNHQGPRVGRIEQYLHAADFSFGGLRAAQPGESQFDLCGFRFGAVLQPGAYAKLRTMHIVKRLEVSISLPGAQAADRERGRSLSQVLDAPLPEGIEKLEIVMTSSAQKNGRLGRQGVMGFVDDALALGPHVQNLFVRGKQNDDTPTEELDLLEQRLETTANVQLGPGGRFPRAARWEALSAALQTWKGSGALPVAR